MSNARKIKPTPYREFDQHDKFYCARGGERVHIRELHKDGTGFTVCRRHHMEAEPTPQNILAKK